LAVCSIAFTSNVKEFSNFQPTPNPKLQTTNFSFTLLPSTKLSMKATRPATQAKAPAAKPKVGQLFEKQNFMWMLIGVAILIIGFLLMAGGGNEDPNVFDPSQVYSTRRITIAPIIILIGLAVEIYAIFRQPKNTGTAD
jgi:Protein of unknown function (DUF3098)